MPYLYSINSDTLRSRKTEFSYDLTGIGSWMSTVADSISARSSDIDLSMSYVNTAKLFCAQSQPATPQLRIATDIASNCVENGQAYRWSGSWYNSLANREGEALFEKDNSEKLARSEAESDGTSMGDNPVPAKEGDGDFFFGVNGQELGAWTGRKRCRDTYALEQWKKQSVAVEPWFPGIRGAMLERQAKE